MTTTPTPSDEPHRERVGDRVVIYARGKKQIFVADFWYDGKHRRKSPKTRNRRIARQRTLELERKLAQEGLPSLPPKIDISEATDQYLNWLKVEDRAPKTISRYRGELKAFEMFAASQGITTLSRVTVAVFDSFRANQSKDRQVSTLYHESIVLKQFTRWCVSRNLLATDPFADCKFSKPPRVPGPVPTITEVNQILARCSPTARTRLLILACSGMRVGELQGLFKRDIDPKAGFITVARQVGGPTKTRRVRRIPIHPTIAPVIRQLLTADKHELLITAVPSARFSDGGHHFSTKKLNERFKAAMTRSGLRGYTQHSLRRFFNTTCVNAGIPERVVRLWMGHADTSMTGVYYNLRDEDAQRFMAQVPLNALGKSETAAEPAA